MWLMASALSRWHTWESAVLLRAAIWLCIPVYWHLHWLFPSPLRRLPTTVWAGAYGLAAALVIAQWFQWLPGSLYGLGFLLALIGILAPLLWRLRVPEHHRQARFLLGAALLATVPPALFGILAVAGLVSVAGATSLLALPILPLFYFYAAYRRQLGPLELRANRLISLYLFLTLLVVLASVLIPALIPFVPVEGGNVIVGVMATAAGGLLSLAAFAPFQRWAERRLLGVPPAAGRLLETYSQRIATCASHDALAALLRDEILPGLLVRQSALVLVEGDAPPQPLYAVGVEAAALPSASDVAPLLKEAGRFRFASQEHPVCPWARVVMPLTPAWNTTGLWLLGRRDPDDFYGQAEINVLLSLAGQTAVALTNILQAKQLRALYRADVNQREAERARLAHELHDQVLNQMAVLRTSLGAEPDSPEFQRAYAAVVASLRQTIGDLRPAMLDYGLFSALKALADDLADRAGAQPQVVLEVPASEARFDPVIEQHLYRIVQQACANTLQHARARSLRISGVIAPRRVELQVADDGQGFEAGKRLLLSDLIARRHFGLAGMQERAALSDAQLSIESTPGQGTRVHIVWHATR
jgi:signal transduction histidine kinase